MRRNLTFLIATLVVVLGAFAACLVTNSHPTLGLDLQGGISITLAPTGPTSKEKLEVAKGIIEQRINGLGISEPQVRIDGENIVIDLPGVKDADRARKTVGQTSLLEVRPVLSEVWEVKSVKGTIPEPKTTTTAAASGESTTTVPAESTTTSVAAAEPPSTAAPSGGPGKARRTQTPDAVAPSGTDGAATTTTAPPSGTDPTTTTVAAPDGAGDLASKLLAASVQPICSPGTIPPLSPADTPSDQQATFAGKWETNERKVRGGGKVKVTERCVYTLGPARLTGNDLSGASKQVDQTGQNVISITFKDDGFKKWNALAAEYFPKQPPQNQVAIVLDGVVLSAPKFETSTFTNNGAQITGTFSENEAADIARNIDYGALPVRLKEQSVQDVSPTLGRDQLTSGIIAGVIGLILVAIYMIGFYRILGVVAMLGLILSFIATYVLITLIGQVLTLAGVVGLIVSLGVTVDSYVVYFERLKDEVRKGKTVRSSLNESYHRSWSTIITADLVSLIGAVVLYVVSVGNVKGFALLLGISTLLDLIISYTFMYPLVSLMCRRPGLIEARWIGIGSGVGSAEANHGQREPEEVPA